MLGALPPMVREAFERDWRPAYRALDPWGALTGPVGAPASA